MKKIIGVLAGFCLAGAALVSCATTKSHPLWAEQDFEAEQSREVIESQLAKIRENKKYVEKDGDIETTVSRSVMKVYKHGQTIYDVVPEYKMVTYKLENIATDKMLIFTVMESYKSLGDYELKIDIQQREEFPKGYGKYHAVFLNNSVKQKIWASFKKGPYFSKGFFRKNDFLKSYNVTLTISKSELERLSDAKSILVFIAGKDDVVTIEDQTFMVSRDPMFPNALFRAAVREFVLDKAGSDVE